MEAVKAGVAEITKNAPVAVYQAKKAINYCSDLDINSGLVLEADI